MFRDGKPRKDHTIASAAKMPACKPTVTNAVQDNSFSFLPGTKALTINPASGIKMHRLRSKYISLTHQVNRNVVCRLFYQCRYTVCNSHSRQRCIGMKLSGAEDKKL